MTLLTAVLYTLIVFMLDLLKALDDFDSLIIFTLQDYISDFKKAA